MKQCVLVELDALLDTRFGTIVTMDREAAEKLILAPEYYNRQIDDFEAYTGISKTAFKEAYRDRNTNTLKNSLPTLVPAMLMEMISKMEIMAIDTPFVEELSVEVNLWPYVLSETEREMMVTVVSAFAGIETPVRTVSIAPPSLTPSLIESKYTGLIIYNFRDWFVQHLEAFKKTVVPTVTLLTPALFHDGIPKKEDYLTEGIREDISPFQLAEVAMLEMIGVNLLLPSIFSIKPPWEEKKTA